jgi:hypothetical protein
VLIETWPLVGIELTPGTADEFRHHLALRRCLVREHRLANKVADGPHVAHRGAATRWAVPVAEYTQIMTR